MRPQLRGDVSDPESTGEDRPARRDDASGYVQARSISAGAPCKWPAAARPGRVGGARRHGTHASEVRGAGGSPAASAGVHVASGNVDGFARRVEQHRLPRELHDEVAPLLRMIRSASDEIRAADDRVAALAAEDLIVKRLRTVPGVGPITATAFVAALDTHERIEGPHQVEA